MAEAVGAFYAVETVAEGVAAGALAVSGSTIPLHAKFRKLKSPSPDAGLNEAVAVTVKNKTYLVGGKTNRELAEHGVHVLSFPPDFGSSRLDGSTLENLDYEFNQPELVEADRPLEQHNPHQHKFHPTHKHHPHHASWARIKHACTAIDDKIYILGGIETTSLTQRQSNTNKIIPLDNMMVYDTLKSNYSLVKVDHEKSIEGLPEPRYAASCTSSPQPQPTATIAGGGPSISAHGTIFLHGGFNAAGLPLHDTWTFDVNTRVWHKFPSIIDDVVEDTSIPGQISYVDSRLWYANGSTVMYLDLAEHTPDHDNTTSRTPSIQSTGRVGSGQWQVVYPPASQDPSATTAAKKAEQGQDPRVHRDVPSPPTAHLIPITTGAGRRYLVHIPSSNPTSLYTFQLPSAPQTGASIKDIVRDKAVAMTNLPDSWRSGKHEWSKIEVVQANMEEGVIERPDIGLNGFAACGWQEYGDIVLIWGGRHGTDIAVDEGWMINLE